MKRLKDNLRRGTLIHADETKVLVKGRPGHVWAFTNLEEVVYAYTPTREGTILDEMLEGFDGVLVSDFYSAYDSPRCKQQKCLIHLLLIAMCALQIIGGLLLIAKALKDFSFLPGVFINA